MQSSKPTCTLLRGAKVWFNPIIVCVGRWKWGKRLAPVKLHEIFIESEHEEQQTEWQKSSSMKSRERRGLFCFSSHARIFLSPMSNADSRGLRFTLDYIYLFNNSRRSRSHHSRHSSAPRFSFKLGNFQWCVKASLLRCTHVQARRDVSEMDYWFLIQWAHKFKQTLWISSTSCSSTFARKLCLFFPINV